MRCGIATENVDAGEFSYRLRSSLHQNARPPAGGGAGNSPNPDRQPRTRSAVPAAIAVDATIPVDRTVADAGLGHADRAIWPTYAFGHQSAGDVLGQRGRGKALDGQGRGARRSGSGEAKPDGARAGKQERPHYGVSLVIWVHACSGANLASTRSIRRTRDGRPPHLMQEPMTTALPSWTTERRPICSLRSGHNFLMRRCKQGTRPQLRRWVPKDSALYGRRGGKTVSRAEL